MVEGVARDADADVRLVGVLAQYANERLRPALDLGGSGAILPVTRHVAEQLLELREKVVAHLARDADDDARRRVPVAEVVGERLASRGVDGLARAERLPAERIRPEDE